MLSVVNMSFWASPNVFSDFDANIGTTTDKLIEE